MAYRPLLATTDTTPQYCRQLPSKWDACENTVKSSVK